METMSRRLDSPVNQILLSCCTCLYGHGTKRDSLGTACLDVEAPSPYVANWPYPLPIVIGGADNLVHCNGLRKSLLGIQRSLCWGTHKNCRKLA